MQDLPSCADSFCTVSRRYPLGGLRRENGIPLRRMNGAMSGSHGTQRTPESWARFWGAAECRPRRRPFRGPVKGAIARAKPAGAGERLTTLQEHGPELSHFRPKMGQLEVCWTGRAMSNHTAQATMPTAEN